MLAVLRDKAGGSAARAALGWRGDRLVYLARSGNSQGRFVWALNFASKDEAETVANGFVEIISNRMPQVESGDTTLPENTRTFRSGIFNATLVHHEEQVWWIENLNADDRDTVIARLTQQYEQPTLAKRKETTEN